MADRLTIEHYVGEAFVKCGQVILGSRILPTGPTQQPRPPRDKRAGRWFLLELEELEGVGKEVELWRKDISSPLVVEILLAPGAAATSGGAAAATALPGESLLERWTLAFERGAPPGNGSSLMGGGGNGTRTYLDEVSIYKRLIILIRSLYSYTRVLPAYKLFRAAKRHPGSQPQLCYRVSRSLQTQPLAASTAPPPRLQDFLFAPVDTPGGRFRVSLSYNPAAGQLALAASAAAPLAAPTMPYTLHEDYLGPGGRVAAPGTSAPASSGMIRPPLKAAMSASVYGAPAAGRSQPMGADGAARNASGGGAVNAAGAPVPAPARSIVRASWSSKDMKVSFSLPPQQLGSPGGLGLGGLGRRSSSGFGSTPSTPGVQSPAHATGRQLAAAAGGGGGGGGGAQHRPPYMRSASSGCSTLGTTPPSYGGGPPPRPPAAAAAAAGAAAAGDRAVVPGGGSAAAAEATTGSVPRTVFASAAAACVLQRALTEEGAESAGSQEGGAGAAVSDGGGVPGSEAGPSGADRTTSLPVAIPARSSSRTRSVNDLQAPAVYGGFEVRPDVAAATAAAASEHAAAAAAAAGSAGGAAAAAAAAAHHRLAPGSAPAAPRGMLGLALGALKPGGAASTAVAAGGSGSAAAALKANSADCPGSASVVLAGADMPPRAPVAAAVAAGLTAHPPRPPSSGSLAGACSASPPTGAGGGAATAGSVPASCGSQPSQALAVVPAPQHSRNPYHQQQQQYQYQYHRHMSLPHGSPPAGLGGAAGGRGVPVPVPVGSLPPYGSPQLPFAFTPSAQSLGLASLHQAMVPLGYFGGPGGATPRAVSGRDVSSLALIRRPSWSSRSGGSLDPALASAGATGTLQPLPSPLYDPLDSSLSNASTPPTGGAATPGRGRGGGGAAAAGRGDPHSGMEGPHSGGGGGRGRRREPSSSSASAIFAFSPTSGMPGCASSSPRQTRRGSAGAVEEEADVEGEEAGGGADLEAAGDTAAATAADAERDSTAADGALHGPAGAGAHADGAASPYDMYAPYDAASAIAGGGGGGAHDPRVFPLAREDSDTDLLPFALDQEGLLLAPGLTGPVGHLGAGAAVGAGQAAGGRQGQTAAAFTELTLTGLAQARERDVAVGAFVRLLAEAAPLAAPPSHPSAVELTGRQALAELAALREQIRSALANLPPV